MYLTSEHTPPPEFVIVGDTRIPTRPYLDRGDNAMLATLGIYWHVTAEGAAPLGYTDWALIDGEYRREPAGTQAERDAAIAAQAAAALLAANRAKWAAQSASRARRAAEAVLATEPTIDSLPQHLAAIQTLQELN